MRGELCCSFCGENLEDGENAYGLTKGCIDGDVEGFRMDLDSEWDIYCCDCINTIDKLMDDYKTKSLK